MRAVTIGILLVAATLALDYFEIGVLNHWSIGKRIGALLMLTAGQLLLAGNVIGDGIRWAIHWIARIIGNFVAWIPWPPHGHHLPAGWATGVGNALVIIFCTWIVLGVIMGILPNKVSTRGLDWNWVYAAALIPVLIFGLPLFSQHAAADLTHSITDWTFHATNSKV